MTNINPAAQTQQVQHGNGNGNTHFQTSKKTKQGKEEQAVNQREQVSKEELDKAVDKANETMKLYRTSIQFKIHEKSGEYYAQVINADTKEVIREVPPEWMLDLVANIEKTVGVLVDEMV